ncbi:hypothetical protein [Murimonas intestini]|uniref:hypothetical protein n=1 Tax=Murimonas intestini TaxID=1337051 RepID=UPI00214B829A|nr:hypothetical protein [Murimonas intestini]MCR1841589.1 hypothetical protein [Murimonas intestini]
MIRQTLSALVKAGASGGAFTVRVMTVNPAVQKPYMFLLIVTDSSLEIKKKSVSRSYRA